MRNHRLIHPFQRIVASQKRIFSSLPVKKHEMFRNKGIFSAISNRTTSISSIEIDFRYFNDTCKIKQGSICEEGNHTINKQFPSATLSSTSKFLNFDDPQSAHGNKSIPEIVKSIAVFKLCQFQPLVRNAPKLLSLSSKFLGSDFTYSIIRRTFFNQFCAGECEVSIKPTLKILASNGIGAILDYAAEDDTSANANFGGELDGKEVKAIVANPPFNQPARIYEYKSEAKCDHHVDIFLDSIRTVHSCKHTDHTGFAAIKVTALGNPRLLEQMSIAIHEANKLFARFDTDGDGIMTRKEFIHAYNEFFNDSEEDERLKSLLRSLDPDGTDQIDYIAVMSKFLTPSDLPRVTSRCRSVGPMALATPSLEEIELLKSLHNRAHVIAQMASDYGVRLLIDAEHVRYQPAIDHLALELQATFNNVERTKVPIIFQTYQCYLKDSFQRIQIDLERSKRYGYHFGAKIVRGAYRIHEAERARDRNEESPVFSRIEETHESYDKAVEYLLKQSTFTQSENSDYLEHAGSKIEVMCATHNQASIEKAVRLMDDLNLHRERQDSATVHFAQLYGMCDHLTYPLGKNRYSVFKYLPYGPIDEVMPYLLRRAEENSDVLGNAGKEIDLMKKELQRRMTHQ